jgi:ankyrin repeat protein
MEPKKTPCDSLQQNLLQERRQSIRPITQEKIPMIPSFTPHFTAPRTQTNRVQELQAEAEIKPIIFGEGESADHDFSQFRQNTALFNECKQQFVQAALHIHDVFKLCSLTDRYALSARDANAVRSSFDALIAHVNSPDHYGPHIASVLGSVKKNLHDLESLVINDNIPKSVVITTIQAMSEQIHLCAGGLNSALEAAILTLQVHTNGFPGRAAQIKAEATNFLISRSIEQYHPAAVRNRGNHIHYRNVYWNSVAASLGQKPEDDPYISIGANDISQSRLLEFKKIVGHEVSASKLAAIIATQFKDQVDEMQIIAGDATLDAQRVRSIMEKSVPALEKSFGQLHLTDIFVEEEVNLESETSSTYALKDHFSLQIHFLQEMKRQEVIDYNRIVILDRQFTDDDVITINMLGNMFWKDVSGKCSELEPHELLQQSPQLWLARQQRATENEIKQNPPAQLDDFIAKKNLEYGEIAGCIASTIASYLHRLERTEISSTVTGSAQWMRSFHDAFKDYLPGPQALSFFAMAMQSDINEADIDRIIAWMKKNDSLNAQNDNGWASVMVAAGIDRADILAKLATAGADLNLPTDNGTTPLMMAAHKGNAECISILAENHAALDATDISGNSALILAASTNHPEVITELIRLDAALDLVNASGHTALMTAVLSNHPEVLGILLESSANLNLQEHQGNSAVMLAIANGNTERAIQLLQARPDLNLFNTAGLNAGMLAVTTGRHEIIAALSEAGCDLNQVNANGLSLTMQAVIQGHGEVIAALARNDADLDYQLSNGISALMLAVHSRNREVIDTLLRNQANMDLQDRYGITAVMLAADAGQIETVTMLAQAGADLELADLNGDTALLRAANSNNIPVLQALIDAGADLNRTNLRKETPLLKMAKEGRTEIVTALIAAGADLNQANPREETPLMKAAKEGHIDIVNALITAGVTLDQQDEVGKTALMYAAKKSDPAALNALIAAGAQLNLRDEGQRTALIFAAENGNESNVGALISAGANPNLQNEDGRSALMIAARKGHVINVDTLIRAGANLNLQDDAGRTALILAARHGHFNAVKALHESGADLTLLDDREESAAQIANRHRHFQVAAYIQENSNPG